MTIALEGLRMELQDQYFLKESYYIFLRKIGGMKT